MAVRKKGLNVAILTWHNHFGESGRFEDKFYGDNVVLCLQSKSPKPGVRADPDSKILREISNFIKRIEKKIKKYVIFDKIVIYAGEGLGAKIITQVKNSNLPRDRIIFVSHEDDWREKETKVLKDKGFDSSQVVNYTETTSTIMHSIMRNILTAGILPTG